MKRILINSNLNFEATALMCAHIQNVQAHSIVITDSFNLLRFGTKLNIDASKLNNKNLTNLYCSKHDDVMIVVSPDLLKANTPDELNSILHNIEMLITEETLETVETSTIYFGSAYYDMEFLQNFAEKFETTFVNLNNYRNESKLTEKFTWSEEIENKDTIEILAYTLIFDKKFHKAASALKKPVILVQPKDLLIMADRERLDDWKVTGLARSLAVEIICKHTGVNKEAVEAWINASASK